MYREQMAALSGYMVGLYSLGLLYLMARQQGILAFGLGGGLLFFGLLQWLSTVRMKQQIVELGITRHGYWMRSLHQAAFDRPAKVIPRHHAMAQYKNERLQLYYDDRLVILKQQNWPVALEAVQREF